uniref:Uncharacterized protein n=1 Tax=Oryza rufipogon TaxID=4529 RepID=A0A0E0MY96_ORYRU
MFSMDGDFAPLLELIKLHRMYGLLLVMDVPWTVGDHCDVGVIGLTKCSATIMSSAVFASMRLNATNQSYLRGDNLKLKTSHGLKIKIKIKEVASTLYMTT